MRGFLFGFFSLALFAASPAEALDLDWSGQFRTEAHWIANYNMDTKSDLYDSTRGTAGGYYAPGGGAGSAHLQTVFMRLRPKVIVNDNVYIKSEWWVGDPIYGMFGSSFPYTTDQRNYNTTFSRGFSISAQRLWGEFLTDLGTAQVGRMPLHYGLGLVWNSGEGIYDRYMSTGDSIRLVSKFGQFIFQPAMTKYTIGNTVGGACIGTACTSQAGSGGLTDYSLMLRYDNPDEGFDIGVNFIKRVGGAPQDPSGGVKGIGDTVAAQNTTTWDIYSKKKVTQNFTVAGEIPLISGQVGSGTYKTYAAAIESEYKFSETWSSQLKFGQAPGQPNSDTGNSGKYEIFYFHPNYKPALIMFNYQLANLGKMHTLNNPSSSATSLASPYDNPIANARYINLGGAAKTGKWTFRGNFIWARAQESASKGKFFYNTWSRSYTTTAATADQERSLGWETDLGLTFHWDDNVQVLWDNGLYFPGKFYKFSNVANSDNETSAVFATVLKLGVTF